MSYWKTPVSSSTGSSLYPDSAASEGLVPYPSHTPKSKSSLLGGRKSKGRPLYPAGCSDTASYRNDDLRAYSPPPPPPPKEKVVPWISTLPTSSSDYLSASIPPTPTRSALDVSNLSSFPFTLQLTDRGCLENLPSSCPALGEDIKRPRTASIHATSVQIPSIRSRTNDPTFPRHHDQESRVPVEEDKNSARSSQRRVPFRQRICDWALERYMRDFVGYYVVCAGCGQIVHHQDFEHHDGHCPDNM
ncbi:hypothetical protein E1B28_005388 [Marasmius oreades]|uniref:Uncharacterized protein n=1 Tax=Marasmius oreades TaxID=181124 RepID=A0A9P7S3F1_9AGAR|nr:uncharacterized protein E1B28_005388 [Marasmius oreades]KAG7094560.1 hypothetical protein E1B28_005388 [Marasmius oreades]